MLCILRITEKEGSVDLGPGTERKGRLTRAIVSTQALEGHKRVVETAERRDRELKGFGVRKKD